MPSLRQLEFAFEQFALRLVEIHDAVVGQALPLPAHQTATEAVALQLRWRDTALETEARELLCSLGANRIAKDLRVEWNPRLKTAAGRADYRQKLISLNPRLAEHPEEIERTLRHELAHILAQFRKKPATDFTAWSRMATGLPRPCNRRRKALSYAAVFSKALCAAFHVSLSKLPPRFPSRT